MFEPGASARLHVDERLIPPINQVEIHPYLPQIELQALHKEKGIHLQAYRCVNIVVLGLNV